MCVGATAAMCGIGVFLTSLAKTEQQAFGITLLVGLFLALVGGNLLPSGSLPTSSRCWRWGRRTGGRWSVSAASTSWASRRAASSGPSSCSWSSQLVAGGLAMTRVRKMVEP